MNLFSSCFHPICKDGYSYIAGLGLASIFVSALSWGLGLLFFMLTVLCCYFFRDPARIVPVCNGVVLSPADGLVAQVAKGVDLPGNADTQQKYTRVVVFLNIMDVHVNRFPVSGTIKSVEYYSGKCSIPSLNAGCGEMQRQEFVILANDVNIGAVGVVQVSGIVARRLVSYCNSGQQVSAGDRLGIIKFGSRVDLYVASSAIIEVVPGQSVIGGETIIASFGGARPGENTEFRHI